MFDGQPDQPPLADAPSPASAPPLSAWFLGPKAEHADLWFELLSYVFQDYVHWRRNYRPDDRAVITRLSRRSAEHAAWTDELTTQVDATLNQLKAHYPFFSPRYIAHMLSEQTLPSVLGYFAGMLYNPNNVTDEAAPVTVKLELEVGRMVAEMLGYNPRTAWAHLCSGGTVANLEALWVARAAQFVPFIAREYAREHDLTFEVKQANGEGAPLRSLTDRQTIDLRPNEAIFMLRRLVRHLVHDLGQPHEAVRAELEAFIAASAYNVKRRGFATVVAHLGMQPRMFVSEAAHYSVKKAADLLGYGEDAICPVPVTDRFRLDARQLRAMLFDLDERDYIAAVVGIVGTTEEGAVDPIHEIKFLRDDLQRERNRSFWLHVDAAWGGYVRTLFRGHERRERRLTGKRPIEEIAREWIDTIGARDRLRIASVSARDRPQSPAGGGRDRPQTVAGPSASPGWTLQVGWSDPDVCAAFLAMVDADSTTVDPHKLGYIPYPAGLVAFKQGVVTDLVVQQAQYISDVSGGVAPLDQPVQVDAVGPFILEGSKPGAAATACWLAHKTIPLDHAHHGRMIRNALLSAQKLKRLLDYHRKLFAQIDRECFGEQQCKHPFTFVPLATPDTNIVCFVAVPLARRGDELVRAPLELPRVNELNERIYRALSLSGTEDGPRLPYGQPYFVSRTWFRQGQYAAHSIRRVLDHLGVTPAEYESHGLFVLRSTVMNPLYSEAESQGVDYLGGFVRELHVAASAALDALHGAHSGHQDGAAARSRVRSV